MKAPSSSPRFLALAPSELCLHAFLAMSTAMIVMTLMMPQTFGFQDFRQWAGMYIDNWCQITACSGRPGQLDVKCEHNAVGKMGISNAVWTSPSHNQLSCAHWAKEMVCGQKVTGGWIATYVRPHFEKDGFYMGDANVCDYDFGSSFPWFQYAIPR